MQNQYNVTAYEIIIILSQKFHGNNTVMIKYVANKNVHKCTFKADHHETELHSITVV